METVEALVDAVDHLQELDRRSLSDADLEQALLAVGKELTRLVSVRVDLVAEAETRRVWSDDGSRSFAAWLAQREHAPRSQVGAEVRLAQALQSMPVTAEALGTGAIALVHARELAECQRLAPDAFADAEEALVGHARRLCWADFKRVVAHWQLVVDPDGVEDAVSRVSERRHLVVHRRHEGSVSIQSGLLDAVGGEAFLDELERLERELFEADWAEAKERDGTDVRAGNLRRTSAQRRADALVLMAARSRSAPADARQPRPLITVYIDYETLTGRLCELASGTPITPGQVLPLLDEADIERIVFGPGNRVIELSPRARFFTGGLRRAIQLRDRHCRWPGCEVPAARCDVDHSPEYAKGGETTQEGGRLFCGPHNRARDGREPEPAVLVDTDEDDEAGDRDDEELTERCRVLTMTRLAVLRPRGRSPDAFVPCA